MSEATIPIKELMEKTEQWLLGQGYKKSTLGFYRATWNRFLSYSASPAYSRETAEQFLLQYFGVDVHAIDQTLDGRMRHARRHMNALDEIFRTGTVCRRKVYGVASIDDDCFDKFFSDYLSYCKIRDFLGHADISTTEVYARIDAEMKRKVFEEKVPNYTPNTTMPWEEDEDLLQWLTQFGKKTF